MKGVIQRRMFVFVSIILFIGSIPPVDAELSANQTVLNAICIDDSTCLLTNSITGIDEIKNSETSAIRSSTGVSNAYSRRFVSLA